MNNYVQNKHEYGFITYLRVTAMAMVMFHHFAICSSSVYLNQFGQFCRLGVYIFFAISGFLFGIKKTSGGGYINARIWYKKRLKRIYIPLELFVLSLAVIYVIEQKTFQYSDWILLILGLPGNTSSITEARHIWFITALLMCYLFTPLMSYIVEKTKKMALIALIMLLCLLPIPLMLIEQDSAMILGIPILWYFLAYILGNHFENIRQSGMHVIIELGILAMSFGARFLTKLYFDGTWIYNRFVVQYTSGISAFCFLLIFSFIFQSKSPGKVTRFCSDISFECYLYHYIFTTGILSLFDGTLSWCLSCLLTLCITFLCAFFMNRVGNLIQKRLP